MRTRVGRVVDVDDLDDFDRLVAGGSRRMRGWRLQGLDLTTRTGALTALDPSGALVLGCAVTDAAADHLRAGGAVVFPTIPDVPADAYRTALYTAGELYDHLADASATGATNPYEATLDARIYAWSRRPVGDVADDVVQALHDGAIEAALDETLAGKRVVGVMGGHAVARGDELYRQAAALGRALAGDGFTVGTGGGPGAMEAANLGSALAGSSDDALGNAVDQLAVVPSFHPSIAAWATAGFDVLARWPGGDGGVGVPTWFYGHEPPNVFASAIAKFFQNAVREATLLQRCTAGIVFLPGFAGTVQEVFQDACENYYAEAPLVAPMVLVGVEHWTSTVPAWPLLRSLAEGRAMAPRIALVDTVDEALSALRVAG